MTSVVVTQTTINASVVQESVSVSVTSSPINVTISPVDINSHSAVTIGTANGLSLSGQVLSLGLSSSLATGALSSTDWSTFNNKQNALGYTPVNIASAEWIDLTDGGTTILHSHAGGGAVWGAITGTLSNQTDLQAALDAKQDDLTFPIASTLGGTGVNNAGTLTNASNTIITGGGTVALGGFTLTVPATGTAALLATANVFTAQQQVTVATATLNALILKTSDNSVTKNILELQTSTAGVLLGVGGTGKIAQASTSTDHTLSEHNTLRFDLNIGTNLSNGTNQCYYFESELVNTAIVSRILIGSDNVMVQADGSTSNFTGTLVGGRFRAITQTSSSVSVTTAVGGLFSVASAAARASWVLTDAISGKFDVSLQSSSAHTTTNAISLLATTHVKNANITITTGYGLKVESQTVAATNYAIYTDLGLVRFGDVVNTTASYQVDGTQVVTNRVIDARCDDAINSGDATTDGVIDALRDAMIQHGLIAAA